MLNLSDSEVFFYYDIAVALGDYENITLLRKEKENRGLNYA